MAWLAGEVCAFTRLNITAGHLARRNLRSKVLESTLKRELVHWKRGFNHKRELNEANHQNIHAASVNSSFPEFATHQDTPNRVPDFSKYRSSADPSRNNLFQYFMVGSYGALAAIGAKATVQDFLVNMSASADVLAMAKVEVNLSSIPEGKNAIIKWRGKPVFVRHRTPDEIEEARSVDLHVLRDPQSDEVRVQKPDWLVIVGVCTHLGCVPIGEAGDFGGWFCPCHGSHYDISGRIRKGPAPLNLEVPQYSFPDDDTLVIG